MKLGGDEPVDEVDMVVDDNDALIDAEMMENVTVTDGPGSNEVSVDLELASGSGS